MNSIQQQMHDQAFSVAKSAPATVMDTIHKAVETMMASGTDDSRAVFLAQAEQAYLDEHCWLIMLGHLLACQANSRHDVMPPQAMGAVDQDEAR